MLLFKRFGWSRPIALCFVIAAGFFLLPNAQAKTSAHKKRGTFSVPLQPFTLDGPALTAASNPAVPLQVASYAPRAIAVAAPRAELAEDRDDEVDETQPIRVAYQLSRPRAATPPQEDAAEVNETMSQLELPGDRPTVAGNRAVVRNGVAYAPSRAPQNVKNAIWAANTLRRKPYVWGGGHGSFYDYGYDCSGSVSFALHYAGLLAAPLPSSDLMRYGERGRGRWITIYSRPGHTFAVIAGLRFDTTDLRRGGNVGPRWYADARDIWGFEARHPAGT